MRARRREQERATGGQADYKMASMTYAGAGVDYDPLDGFKRACQRAAGSTVAQLARHGLSEPAGVRGESAYLIETPTEYWAHVEEGLGTKNLVRWALLTLGSPPLARRLFD